ncbi:MAG: sigma-70 family RNA polymerase sigma factor [Lewinellaceae bacterium]|nr:sigma-70 family RNA polymerase sigma factor [Lewinellaceae bacterium]
MNTKNATDDDLLYALRTGGAARQKAWEYIYLQWHRSWESVVIQLGGNTDQAQEALNDVAMAFERAVTTAGFRLTSASLRTYLVTCIVRRWKRVRKREQSLNPISDENIPESFFENVEREIMQTELTTAVDALIQILNERCRRILRLFGLSYSMEEIAAAEGLNGAGKAKKAKYKCQKKLITYLQNQPDLEKRLKALLHD